MKQVATTPALVAFVFLGLLFHPENGGSTFIRKADLLPPTYCTTQNSSYAGCYANLREQQAMCGELISQLIQSVTHHGQKLSLSS
jgi:hypothetical protein